MESEAFRLADFKMVAVGLCRSGSTLLLSWCSLDRLCLSAIPDACRSASAIPGDFPGASPRKSTSSIQKAALERQGLDLEATRKRLLELEDVVLEQCANEKCTRL